MGYAAESRFGFDSPQGNQALWNTVELLQNQVRDLIGRDAVNDRANAPASPAARIAEILRMRALRSRFFKAELFADPAWDMLLDLYRAELDQHRVSITSLCTASAVPTSTALRWLRALEEEGLVRRRQDPLDGRRTFVGLTSAAVEAMNSYFEAVGQAQPL
jgi:DNA-binding MarR family transcriptional regulator